MKILTVIKPSWFKRAPQQASDLPPPAKLAVAAGIGRDRPYGEIGYLARGRLSRTLHQHDPGHVCRAEPTDPPNPGDAQCGHPHLDAGTGGNAGDVGLGIGDG